MASIDPEGERRWQPGPPALSFAGGRGLCSICSAEFHSYTAVPSTQPEGGPSIR